MSITPAVSPPPLELTGIPALEQTVTAPPVEQTETPPTLINPALVPMPDAGDDVSTNLGNDVTFYGQVLVNLPLNQSVTWSKISGPGTVVFSDPDAITTTASFSSVGTYELAFTVENGGITASDRVIVNVIPRTPPSTLGLTEGIALYLGDEMQFAGNNDYVEVAHDDDYLLNEGTVAFWFKADNTSTEQGLFSKDSNGYDTGGQLSFTLESDGRVSVRLQSTSNSYTLYANSSIQPDSWQHVALNFGPGGMELFLNGELQQSDVYTGGLGSSSGGVGNLEPIVLGALSSKSGDLQATPVVSPLLGGAIDEVEIGRAHV